MSDSEASSASGSDNEPMASESDSEPETAPQSKRQPDYEEDERPKKRKRKGITARDFIDDIVDVDHRDDDESEDDFVEQDGGLHEAEEAARLEKDLKSSYRHSALDRERHERDEDELIEYYQQKYVNQKPADADLGDGYNYTPIIDNDISEQGRLPDVKDPSLWIVKCLIGTERECAMKLMRKFLVEQNKEDPLQIKSVVAPESAKGFIYVEAYKKTHVKQAVEGINFLRSGIYEQTMVPTNEMKDVLRVIKTMAQLKPGAWVRLKRGVYKEDLAQVDYVEAAQNTVSIKLIPRIDYNKLRGFRSSENKARNRVARPVQKLFNEDNIRAIGGEINNDGDFLIFEGARYSRKGYLYRTLKMDMIQVEGRVG